MKQIHPIAECYPKLSAKEYEALKADIQKSGLLVTIVTFQDKVLDGVHRQKACDELGITPRYQEFPTSVDPYALVVSLNERRRNLTTGQRAVVAERMATLKHGGDRSEARHGLRVLKDVALKEAAALNRVGATSVDEARYTKEHGIPEIHKALEEGKLKPYRAKELSRLPKEQQAEALKQAVAGNTEIGRRRHSHERKKTPAKRSERKGIQAMLNELQNGKPKLGLTREEFDPTGETKNLSSMEFLDKYGHVQIMTKTELEADQRQSVLMAWVSALNDLKTPLEKFLECEPFNLQEFEAWIKRAPDTRLRRITEKLSLIIKARESIEWLLPILNRSNEHDENRN